MKFYNYKEKGYSDVPEDPELWEMVPKEVIDKIDSWSNGEFVWNSAYMHSAIVAGPENLQLLKSPWGTYYIFVRVIKRAVSAFPGTAEDWLAFCNYVNMLTPDSAQYNYHTLRGGEWTSEASYFDGLLMRGSQWRVQCLGRACGSVANYRDQEVSVRLKCLV